MPKETIERIQAKRAQTRAKRKAGIEPDLQLRDVDSRNLTPALEKKLEQILGNKILLAQLASWLTSEKRGEMSIFAWAAEFAATRDDLEIEDVGAILRALVSRNGPLKNTILEEARRLRLLAREQ
jgi:hypothetical protein